jgi:hypothetical protein
MSLGGGDSPSQKQVNTLFCHLFMPLKPQKYKKIGIFTT